MRGLLVFFGPMLLPKAISLYRRTRNAPATHGLKVQPVPSTASRSLYLLAFTSLVFLVLSLPLFGPEDVFRLTQSRLQIQTDVLFNRVAGLRPNHALTPRDERLRARFVNTESKLLYLTFGPEVVGECPWCSSEDPKTYLYYALPSLLTPHVVNLLVLALATSQPVAGRYGGPWRKTGTLAAAAVAFLDCYLVNDYGYAANARATRLSEIDFFHWRARSYRLVAVAALDAVLAALVWLSCTNRAFAKLPTPAEKTDEVIQGLLRLRAKVNCLGIVKNTTSRDDDLRKRSAMYWAHEGKVMGDVMEDREVIDSVNDALENRRVDITKISGDAEQYATEITKGLYGSGGAAATTTTQSEDSKKDQ